MHNTSVIVRVKNEEQWIGHALQSIIDNVNNSKIIIIDNNSDDNSINIAKLFQHDTSKPKSNRYADIDIIKINEYSPGKAINLAVEKVKTNTLLLLSSHCEISKYSITLVKNLLESHVAVFGKQIPRYFGKRIVPRYIWSHYGEQPVINMYSDLEDRYFLHNAFCAYKTDFLKKNPFNENLVGKEDRYWANDVVKAGKTYAYEPNIICQHHFTNNGNTWRGID